MRRAELRAEDDRKHGFKPDLPGEVDLYDRDLSMIVWRVLKMVDWKWLPDEVLRQPEALLSDLLTIQAHYGAIHEIITDKQSAE